jgi:hypothetical protein
MVANENKRICNLKCKRTIVTNKKKITFPSKENGLISGLVIVTIESSTTKALLLAAKIY